MSKDFVDDVISGTLYNAFKYRTTYKKEMGPFAPWFNAIAMRLALKQLRADLERNEVPLSFEPEFVTSADDDHDVGRDDIATQRAMEIEALRSELDGMKPRDRDILERAVVHEESSSSIGDVLKMKPTAVRVNLHRTLKRLKAYMVDRHSLERPENAK